MLVWLKDLQSNWLSWLAVALTLVVSSTSCTLALAMLVASPGAEENPAGQLGGTVLGMSLCVVVLVTLSQMRLIIAEREPVYRSWRMVGMPGWVILFFILGQVAVVSAGRRAARRAAGPPSACPVRARPAQRRHPLARHCYYWPGRSHCSSCLYVRGPGWRASSTAPRVPAAGRHAPSMAHGEIPARVRCCRQYGLWMPTHR